MLPIVWREKPLFMDMCHENLFNRPSKTKSCEVHHFYSSIQIDIRLQVRINLGLVRHKSIIQSPPDERKGWKGDGQGAAGRRRRTGERRLCGHHKKEKQQGRGRRAGSRLLASTAPRAATPTCPPSVRCSSGRPSSPSPCRTARLTIEVTLPPSLLLSSSQLICAHLETWPWDVGGFGR